MRTALGAATELSADEILDGDFKAFDHVHIEGFMIHNPKVLEKSLNLAIFMGRIDFIKTTPLYY